MWEEEYKKHFINYMKDGALFLSVRNFFRREIIKARIEELEKIVREWEQWTNSPEYPYYRKLVERIAELNQSLGDE